MARNRTAVSGFRLATNRRASATPIHRTHLASRVRGCHSSLSVCSQSAQNVGMITSATNKELDRVTISVRGR